MRALWIRLHLLAASFVSAILLVIAVSGGFYLFGEKGKTSATAIEISTQVVIDVEASDLKSQLSSVLAQNGVEHDFEYVKISGNALITRPTSKTYYELKLGSAPTLTRHDPDWLKTIVELHKGHGPVWFKNFQKLTAGLLVFIVLTGLWLGVSSAGLRKQSLGAAGLGLVVFLLLAFVL